MDKAGIRRASSCFFFKTERQSSWLVEITVAAMARGSLTHFTSLRQGCSSPPPAKANTCFVTRRSSARRPRPRVVRRNSLSPPFYSCGLGFQNSIYFFFVVSLKTSRRTQWNIWNSIIWLRALNPVFPQRTDKVLIVALSTSAASVGDPWGLPELLKNSRSDAYDGLSACALSELARQSLP